MLDRRPHTWMWLSIWEIRWWLYVCVSLLFIQMRRRNSNKNCIRKRKEQTLNWTWKTVWSFAHRSITLQFHQWEDEREGSFYNICILLRRLLCVFQLKYTKYRKWMRVCVCDFEWRRDGNNGRSKVKERRTYWNIFIFRCKK